MLGEQLIKNDRIALIELAKNCYDADATEVLIRFDGFGSRLDRTATSTICVIDNGDGMSEDVVRAHWLSPATSVKVQKKRSSKPKTAGGRVVQGEKGIGRFAMFKLGSIVRMTTRSRDSAEEVVVELDISFLDEHDEGARAPIDPSHLPRRETEYLDELTARISRREPTTFDGISDEGGMSTHGTRLEIGLLRNSWSRASIDSLHQDLFRLRPLEGLLTGKAGDDPLEFHVDFLVNGERPDFLQDPELLLAGLVDRAVLKVVGSFDARAGSFAVTVNDADRAIDLNSHEIRGLRLFKETFGAPKDNVAFSCGDFTFELLFFDLRPSAVARFKLDPVERDLVKAHRIYLYRDQVRVMPYGDPDDDWLQLDIIRGTQAASRIFSNDQALGLIYITQQHNPDLRDKTNREGLIDSGSAFLHFVLAIQLLVTYLRRNDFARYLADAERRTEAEQRRQATGLAGTFETLAAEVKGNRKVSALVADLARTYQVEHEFMVQRVNRTEDLAGVGLSVETASHDVVATANQALRDMRLLQQEIGHEVGVGSSLFSDAGTLVDSMSFIVSRLQDVQGLFVSSRQKPHALDVVQFIRKVQSIYRRVLAARHIKVEYVGDERLEVKTVDAPLLQIFLNLMDNAVYWLQAARVANPEIRVAIDAASRTVTFSDNGPGIDDANRPYVFDAFFSSKGDEGRGLGLYIAREVAHRNAFDLRLMAPDASGLGGASFVLELGESG
jgi:signal transduction histidine kinase